MTTDERRLEGMNADFEFGAGFVRASTGLSMRDFLHAAPPELVEGRRMVVQAFQTIES
jgi:hypothetical protein